MAVAVEELPRGEPVVVEESVARKIGRVASKAPVNIVLLFVALLWLLPTFALFMTSLMTPADYNSFGWWKLLADPSGYIFTWLLGYSGGLGSIAGVLIADYWVVRRRRLRLEDLYLEDGVYGTWNGPALVATVAGCLAAWGGLVVPALRPMYDYAWFAGFGVAFLLHVALMRRSPRPATDPSPLAEG